MTKNISESIINQTNAVCNGENNYQGNCPICLQKGKTQTLFITIGEKKIFLECTEKCNEKTILKELGITEADLKFSNLKEPKNDVYLHNEKKFQKTEEKNKTETKENPDSIKLTPISSIKKKEVSWLWKGVLPLGKVSLLSGDPGIGKSLVTCFLSAYVSSGKQLPFSPGIEEGSSIILNPEDQAADTIKPRLEPYNANQDKIIVCEKLHSYSLSDIAKHLDEKLISYPNTKLIVIDPFSAFVGKRDINSMGDSRYLLTPLQGLAEKNNISIVVVHHMNKGDAKALYRAAGSIGLTAAARTAWLLVEHPDEKNKRILWPTKNNLGSSQPMIFEIKAVEDKPFIVFDDEFCDLQEHEIFLEKYSPKNKISKIDQAKELLQEILSRNGPVPQNEILTEAKRAGIGERNTYAAKKELGIVSYREGYSENGKYLWTLPENESI